MLSSKQRAGRILLRLISLALLVAAAPAGNSARAQNLVPNPGFESYLTCPTGDFQFDGYVANWKNPTVGGSPDYFNACNKELCSQSVPSARYGFQSAHDSASGGAAFAGIYCTNIGVNYREYLSVKLADTLVKGQWYSVRFFASLAEASPVGIMNLGAFVGRNPTVSTSYVYPASPQIRYEQFLTESGRWVEVSGMYQATGGENYLIIGCFDKKLRTTPSNTRGACSEVKYAGAYYYIDDVSLLPAAPPGCFNSSEYYDVSFKPAGISENGECCWNVSVASRKGACPLYGINAFLLSGTTPFTWRTDIPVMPEETREIGRLCLGDLVGGDSIFVAYLDRLAAPMSSATRALRCGADPSSLAIRAVPFDAGSADFCSFDLFIDNLAATGTPVEDLTLRIDGGAFEEADGVEWTLAGADHTGLLHWRASSGSAMVPGGGRIHCGRFSVGRGGGSERIIASLYQHPAAEGGEAEIVQTVNAGCTIPAGTCYEMLHATILDGSDGVGTDNGCYVVNIRRDEGGTCEVSSISITNATSGIRADWQPYQLPAPLDLGGDGRDAGTICFDRLNPPQLNITYYDAGGAPICTKRLETDRIAGRNQLRSGVASPGARSSTALEIAPNPARGATRIAYRIEAGGAARLEIFAMTGELVETIAIADAAGPEGALGYDTRHLAPGIYRVRMISPGATSLATLVVTR